MPFTSYLGRVTTKPVKKNKAAIVVPIVLVVLILLAVALFFIWRGRKSRLDRGKSLAYNMELPDDDFDASVDMDRRL